MSDLIPIGVWVSTSLAGDAAADEIDFIGFTYVDPGAGFSAKGGPKGDPASVQAPPFTLRLPLGQSPVRVLTPAEVAELGLPATPRWLKFFGPQPSSGTLGGAWCEHPALVASRACGCKRKTTGSRGLRRK